MGQPVESTLSSHCMRRNENTATKEPEGLEGSIPGVDGMEDHKDSWSFFSSDTVRIPLLSITPTD